MIEIELPNGESRVVEIGHFKALDGFDIQGRFLEYAASTDRQVRRAFVMEILSYSTVHIGNSTYRMETDALINNHLQTWKNIEVVFEAVLSENGIDPTEHVNRPHFWANAGAEMAVSFAAELTKLVGPALSNMVAVTEKTEG